MAAKKPPPWKRPAPKAPKRKRAKALTTAQKRTARDRARRAGRTYPNLVDNMAVAAKKTGSPKKRAAKRKRATKKRRAIKR